MSEIVLRPLSAADVPSVLALQAQCYGADFLEDAQAFAAKLRAAEPYRTCWMAWRGEQPLAYLVGLPLCHDSLPALNAQSLQLPAEPRLLYLHDLAVAPAGRSLGLARRLVEHLERRAGDLGLKTLGLVAVQGAETFWQRQGYASLQQLSATLAAKLASFGPEARFMQRSLA
ncbi:GNAT family N-acetyltransferase [Paucibacter sp. M5-1]|uniref:GNAT family N-acetyltransferase n=1 Tax=Paucibacter sp. M5-1 TaxID=3015998 RepID=UPI0022B92708|nr:GNAT family N-acetyltransferase [Paucibacter sp. M5-1]MCZ7882780.1 GNAT family N-acetyltransferase [Paucibacter sp. M5-1]